MKAFLTLLCGTALIVSFSQAQTSTTTTATTAGGRAELNATTVATGTITDFTPGSSIVLSTEAGAPTLYRFGSSVTYVTTSGKVIDATQVKRNDKVTVHYVRQGGGMVVDKVIVNNAN